MELLRLIERYQTVAPKKNKELKKQKEAFCFANQFQVKVKTYEDLFLLEVYETSLKSKQTIENHFFKEQAFLKQHQSDVSYEQRLHLYQVALAPTLASLPCFKVGEELIFIPHFTIEQNRLYTKDIIALEYKRYQQLVKDESFQRAKLKQYKSLPYLSGFSSLTSLLFHDQSAYFYFEKGNLLCAFDDEMWTYFPLMKRLELDVLHTIVKLWANQNEDELFDLLAQQQCLKKKVLRKYKKIRKRRGVYAKI